MEITSSGIELNILDVKEAISQLVNNPSDIKNIRYQQLSNNKTKLTFEILKAIDVSEGIVFIDTVEILVSNNHQVLS